MTYLQLVNAVLRRLRESEVATVNTNAYSKLIGDLVNETKREVEDAWNWVQLRSTVQVTTIASTFGYVLTGTGDRSRILQVVDETNFTELQHAPYKWMNYQFNTVATEGLPTYWDVNGTSGGDLIANLYPIPNGVYVIDFHAVIPQDDLSNDADVLVCPYWPVVIGAHAKAISERGEDSAVAYAEAMMNYQKALGDAIAMDSTNVPFEQYWTVN